jgi:hypothetical protein
MNTKPPRPLLSSFLRGDRAGRADFDLPRHSRTTQGLSLCCFNIVGGEILTFPVPRHSHYSGDRLSLWCFNIVGGEISTLYDLPRHSHYSGVIPMVFEHSGGRDFDLSRHSHYLTHYSGVIPMVFQHSGGRDFDLSRHSHYSGVIPMVFEHSGGRDYARLPRHSHYLTHYSGVIPMVFEPNIVFLAHRLRAELET